MKILNLDFFQSFRGFYAIIFREITVFFREKPRLISSFIGPIIWLVLFGAGFSFNKFNGFSYQDFIFPGILLQTFMFSSIFYGAYLVWDKKIDILKAILVSPLDRKIIFAGKAFSSSIIAIFEVIILLIFGYILGINFEKINIALLLFIVFFASLALAAIGLSIGSLMESPEGFQLLGSVFLFPLFFLSGALFDINNLPGLLAILARLNPISYIVDLLRWSILGIHTFDILFDFEILGIFLIFSLLLGSRLFENMKL
jgi:ABC-2 type transport system permease protein